MKCAIIVLSEWSRLNFEFKFWGLAKVTEWKRDLWHEDAIVAMFPTSKHEYPFLTFHIHGNWWWCSKRARKLIAKFQPKPWSTWYFVTICNEEYESLKRDHELLQYLLNKELNL